MKGIGYALAALLFILSLLSIILSIYLNIYCLLGQMIYQFAKIDFNRYDYGDPWEEFNRIVWCVAVSPHFATGRIHGYFNGNPPIEFFRFVLVKHNCNTYV